MLRQRLISKSPSAPHEFKWRSREVSRLEGLSDTVFGFAITLLIVSLEVPRTSGQLLETMRGFIAFALTFGVLYSLWYRQFVFFRRYGLEDTPVVLLNGALLLFVLFFVFPFKFLANAMVDRALGLGKTVQLAGGRAVPVIQPGDWPALFAVYGLGFAAIFVVFAALFHHAYTKRDELELNSLEAYDTRESVRIFLINAALGVIVGLNGLVLASARDTRFADMVSYVLGAIEIAGAFALLRFRSTRKRRRAAVIRGLDSTTAEPIPAHAN
jgi:uncharacterized membrane protein